MKVYPSDSITRRRLLTLAAASLCGTLAAPALEITPSLPVLDLKDRKEMEEQWASKVEQISRQKLINLYNAENEDIERLRKKEITEDQKQVKLCYSDFVGDKETAEDKAAGGIDLIMR